VLADLDLDLSSEDQSLIERACQLAREGGNWNGIQHFEPGGDNLLVVDGLVRLIDFEGSAWGNVLRDVALPGMAWGHLAATYALSTSSVSEFEARYFDTLGNRYPALVDSADDSLPMAKLALGLENLGASYGHCDSERWGPWGGERGRSSLISQWQTLADIAACGDVWRQLLWPVWRQLLGRLLSLQFQWIVERTKCGIDTGSMPVAIPPHCLKLATVS